MTHEKDAANLSFDITRQFITIGIGGIAFLLGLSHASPTSISTWFLWLTLIVFGASVLCGLLFFMRGVNHLSEEKSYDIYEVSLRILSGSQIALVLLGVVLLLPLVGGKKETKSTEQTIQIQLSNQETVTYPISPEKNYIIEIENGKMKLESVSSQKSSE